MGKHRAHNGRTLPTIIDMCSLARHCPPEIKELVEEELTGVIYYLTKHYRPRDATALRVKVNHDGRRPSYGVRFGYCDGGFKATKSLTFTDGMVYCD